MGVEDQGPTAGKENWELVSMTRIWAETLGHLFSMPPNLGIRAVKGTGPLTFKAVRHIGAAVSDFIWGTSTTWNEDERYSFCHHRSSTQAIWNSREYALKFSVSDTAALRLTRCGAGLLLLVALILSASNPLAATPERVAVYTYHTHPPFITGEQEGLTFDLAKYLSEKSAGRFDFQAVSVSRPRLNERIEKPDAMIVPWVNPAWFKDVEETRYHWSERPLMEDANGIISHSDRGLIYEDPSSLAGLLFGGIRGHIYTGIDDFIRNSETTRRVDADNHLANFKKLTKGRIDVTLTPESAARYLIKEHSFSEELYLSPKPHSRYSRRMMVPNGRSDIMAFINEVLAASRDDEAWSRMFERYQ
jgi:ABC-type amino acid transport substrate-binding protein